MKFLFFFFGFILFVSTKSPKVISKNSYGDIQLGKTTIKEVKKEYKHFESRRLSMHAMYRTEAGRVCKNLVQEFIKVKKEGIVFFFEYERNEPIDSIKVYGIDFYSPFKGKTSSGIGINSSMKDVLDTYGSSDLETDSGRRVSYDWIVFEFDENQKVNKYI